MPSLRFWYFLLLLQLSSDILGFASVFRFVFFSYGSGCGSAFLYPFVSAFPTCYGQGWSLRSYSAFFRMLWLWLGFSSLPSRFPPATVMAVPSCLPQIFPVFISVFHILRLRLLLHFGAPHVVLRAASSPFTVPRLSGYCFPCASARFLLQGFHQLISLSTLSLLWSSGCILSLGVCSSSSLSVVFFTPASVLPPPVCLAMFSVALWFSGASGSFGSPVTVAIWSPFGTSLDCYGLCFLSF